jgi:hypothetical protein
MAVALNFYRYILNFTLKFKSPSRIFEVRRYRGVKARALEFAVAIDDSVGIRTDRPSTLTVARTSMMIYRRSVRQKQRW